MTYEQKLQKLRDASVIDMELSFGCELFIQNYVVSVTLIWDNRSHTITEETEYKNFLAFCWTYTQTFEERHIKKNLGHDLLYGRVCRWVETKYNVELCYWLDWISLDWDTSDSSIRLDLQDILRNKWHRKDLPLSQQENKEEIIDFILSLLP